MPYSFLTNSVSLITFFTLKDSYLIFQRFLSLCPEPPDKVSEASGQLVRSVRTKCTKPPDNLSETSE